MELKTETDGKRLTIYLRGELDHHAAGRLREEIDAAAVRVNANELVLDFTELGFMDSSGIGLILGRYKRMTARGGTLRVCGAGERLLRVMQMAGLGSLGILQKGEDWRESGK